jgi:hypothetical protein
MKVVTNETKVKRYSRIARLASAIGFGLLVAGLVLSFRLSNLQEAYLSTLGGFVLATIGAYNVERWVRDPVAHQMLRSSLKGLNDRYALFNYLLPAPHVLLTPRGLVVMRAKRQDGRVVYKDGRWKQDFKWSHLFQGVAREWLGDPTSELKQDIRRVRKWVEERLPEYADDIDVEGLVIFLHWDLKLEVENPPVTVVRFKDLKRAIRGPLTKEMRPLRPEVRKAILETVESRL